MLSYNVVFNIAKQKIMRGLIKTICNMYEKSLVSNKVYLKRQLFNLQMTKGALVAQHLKELNIVTTLIELY